MVTNNQGKTLVLERSVLSNDKLQGAEIHTCRFAMSQLCGYSSMCWCSGTANSTCHRLRSVADSLRRYASPIAESTRGSVKAFA